MDLVRYLIDADDRLIAFNEGWTTFARENDGEAFLPPRITGRPLWDFISDAATADIYHTMIGRVRRGAQPIRFDFRCDSPDRRRLLRMVLSADTSGGVAFSVTAVREEHRRAVPLLDAKKARSASFITVCAWCKRVRLAPSSWVEIEQAVEAMQLFEVDVMPGLTHGMCERCQQDIAPLVK